ncbi:MAG TPA: cysteine dioxygenase family protein [Pyrinomonadaceae bacterium]|jgi:cysteine dioxygenase
MSTGTTTTPHADARGAAQAAEAAGAYGLAGLVERLARAAARPTFDELNALLGGVEVGADELRPYVGFKEGTYARHRVHLGEHAELLVLCWRPGQRTPIHDHAGSFGAVKVLRGVMWETLFGMGESEGLRYLSAREWTPGLVTGADVPDIHQLGNPDVSGQDLVTLHLYSPPLASLNVYKVGRSESTSTLWMNSWNPTI